MNNSYEKQYIDICKNILEYGYYANNRTGVMTYKLPHQIIQIDLEKEFPILKSKFVAFKTAINEMLWIMQGHNNVNELNSHIWDQWASEDGSIGKTYGYQIKKYNQINRIIKTLKEDPQNRRMLIDLWNFDDLDEMNLEPCCCQTFFDVTNGRLNCMLVQRSGDFCVGIPFDVVEYATLTLIIAKLTGLKPGLFSHIISNAHIYENHIENAEKMIKNYNLIYNSDKYKEIRESVPKIILNIEGKEFNNIKDEDIILTNYQYLEKMKFSVAK